MNDRRTVRPPAVAGTFYPASAAELCAELDKLLAKPVAEPAAEPSAEPAAEPAAELGAVPVACIVPHAGYRWSGPTAAHVYRRLRDALNLDRVVDGVGDGVGERVLAGVVDRVVILGPAHRVPLHGLAVPTVTHWSTPLGQVAIDVDAGRELVDRGLAVADDAPHAPEHSIEVQVPFLQRVCQPRPVPRLLPVCVGQAPTDLVAAALDVLLPDVLAQPRTVVLCSTDLSHYLTEPQARRRDAATVAAILDLAPERIGPGDACGLYALRGLLAWARRRQLRVEPLHVATSADTGGPPDRVVGYSAFAMR